MFKIGDERIEARATDGYLISEDIKELLGVSYGTVWNFFKNGKLQSDSASYVGSRQRKRVEVEEFKRFLNENPKYYVKVYGEPIEKDEPKLIEEPVVEVSTASDVLTELFEKLESIESLIAEHENEIVRLNAQKEALESVIDMF